MEKLHRQDLVACLGHDDSTATDCSACVCIRRAANGLGDNSVLIRGAKRSYETINLPSHIKRRRAAIATTPRLEKTGLR